MDLKTLMRETKKIPDQDKHCITLLMKQWEEDPPFPQKKILMNLHLTLSSLLLVEAFLKSGSDFYITCTESLVCHNPIKDLLVDLGRFITHEQLSQFEVDDFEVILDCGAYLIDSFKPKYGFVELTQVAPSRYNGHSTKILNIDNSFVKQIETCFGTGDGFVRAIKVVCEEMNLNFLQLRFLIFGFGKVGRGIYNCLYKAGIPKSQLIVAEISFNRIDEAKQQGITTFDLKKERLSLLKLLKSEEIDCAVTATGVCNAISKYFNHDDFNKVKILSNMGTDDEWGDSFLQDHVYYAKRPINFMLEHPTLVKYLDPIFTLYAFAVKELIETSASNSNKIFYPSISLQQQVLSIWLDQNSAYKRDICSLWTEDFPVPLVDLYDKKNK